MIQNESAYEAAIRRNIINNAAKTFMKRPRAVEVVDWLNWSTSSFAASLLDSLHTYGKLTDKQFDAVLRIMEQDAERKARWEQKRQEMAAASNYVGVKGQKLTLENVVVEAVIVISKPQFSYYDSTEQQMYLLRDQEGNRLVHRPSSWSNIAKGDVVRISAKVKDHTEYKGEKQTILWYAKVELQA